MPGLRSNPKRSSGKENAVDASPTGPPPAKKTRLSSRIKREESAKDPTPAPTVKAESQDEEQGQTPAEEEPQVTLLPNRVYRSRPLPTLPELQPIILPTTEYQSIDSSGVLASSLDRSRKKWLAGEFFQKYWTKTASSKKDSKNASSSNPPKTWMKEVGRCTIIVEPLIFECNVYISKDPAIIAATQQQNHAIHQQLKQQVQQQRIQQQQQQYNSPTSFGAQSRPSGTQTPGQHRPFAVNSHNNTPKSTIKHANGTSSTPGTTSSKQQPDPVIQMLASRASTDRDLKELMKIVATGGANPEQLRAFQKHIDELNALVAAQAAQAAQTTPTAQPTPKQSPSMHAQSSTPRPAGTPIQQRPSTPAVVKKDLIKPPFPVVIEFADPGASPDRFLFPPYSIVESLGSYSVLASFLVFRKGSEASASMLFDEDTEYYEPVTVKIDVVAGTKSVEVLDHIKRSVKPGDEVRRWMLEQMRTRRRADMRFLALKLPHESELPPEEDLVEESPPPTEVKKRGPYRKKADREREQAEKEQQEKERLEKEQQEKEKLEKEPQQNEMEKPKEGEGTAVPTSSAPNGSATEATPASAEAVQPSAAPTEANAIVEKRSTRRSTRHGGDVLSF